MKVAMTKKTQHAAAKALKAGSPVPIQFNLQDNGDDTFTVLGVDAAGNTVDISGVASLQASSDAPAVVTVDAPSGMSSAIHAATPAPAVGATANITLTVTWTDGSVGPFTITWPVNIVAGPATGIVVQPGTPTVHVP